MAGAPHLEAFLDAARYFIGLTESGNNRFTDPRGNELWQLWGWNASGTPWCAIFVGACAQKAGITNIIAKSTWARGVLEDTRDKFGGVWVDGPFLNGGNAVVPQAGDLILFYTGPGKDDRHVGIVESVDPDTNTIYTIEGNSSNACRRNQYRTDYHKIYAYVHPDWALVGDDVPGYLSGQSGAVLGPLYQNRNDRHDMTLRQVGFVNDTRYTFTNNGTGVGLSIINYTSVLGDLYDLFAPGVSSLSIAQVDTSNLLQTNRVAVDFFLAQGFSASSASAVVGCLRVYSGLNPSNRITSPDKSTWLYGLGGWDQKKWKNVQARVGLDYLVNYTGQLQYIADDLVSNYGEILARIKMQPLNLSSVDHVVDVFMPIYNKYYNASTYITAAKKNAHDIYETLVITLPGIVGGNAASDFKDENGNKLSAQFSVDIPASVPQTGIIDDFTSYSYWYSQWNRSSPQRKLAEMWANQGFPCDKGIATIGGYYCVAVRPKFGKCGEVLQINLQDNISFPAIICDEKGADAGSEWGHVKGGGAISLIEWQRVKTVDGKVVTSGIGNANVDPRGFNDWYTKHIVNITNYGPYTHVGWG